eukprot:TRINITY_DN13753_c0_g3_i1.p1 TRINITY_DN13753_c0_g3~~TRINITY_DN13753_c0_g3_i1.p1  ORF type:complete len:618 (+),score=128.63 TRINITY_DN13753_c0_g3_i1:171-2024(+)
MREVPLFFLLLRIVQICPTSARSLSFPRKQLREQRQRPLGVDVGVSHALLQSTAPLLTVTPVPLMKETPLSPQDLLRSSSELLAISSSLYESAPLTAQPVAGQEALQQRSPEQEQPAAVAFTGAGNGESVSKLQNFASVRPPPYPLYNRMFEFFNMNKAVSKSEMLLQADAAEQEESIVPYFWLSVATLVLTGLYVNYKAMRTRSVDPEHEDDIVLERARGRPCWNVVCGVLSVVLALGVFNVTITQVRSVNAKTTLQPVINTTVDGVAMEEMRFPMNNTGVRAFEASQGVTCSLLMAGIVLIAWRADGPVRMTSGLLSQYMLKGATFSLAVAMLFELLGQAALTFFGFTGLDGPTLGTALMMLVVGFSEEFGKLIAVSCGTFLSVDALKSDRTSRECCLSSSCCCGASLAESPRMLALAGLAAGFGFMTCENAGYVMSAAVTPPTVHPEQLREGQQVRPEDMNGGTATVMTMITILIRVLLNNHPWWTGISMIRLANVAFEDQRKTACLSICTLLWAVWPSAVIHALFDFILTAAPGVIALPMPILFWYGSRRLFASSWPEPSLVEAEAEARALEAEADAASAAEAAAPRPGGAAASSAGGRPLPGGPNGSPVQPG